MADEDCLITTDLITDEHGRLTVAPGRTPRWVGTANTGAINRDWRSRTATFRETVQTVTTQWTNTTTRPFRVEALITRGASRIEIYHRSFAEWVTSDGIGLSASPAYVERSRAGQYVDEDRDTAAAQWNVAQGATTFLGASITVPPGATVHHRAQVEIHASMWRTGSTLDQKETAGGTAGALRVDLYASPIF